MTHIRRVGQCGAGGSFVRFMINVWRALSVRYTQRPPDVPEYAVRTYHPFLVATVRTVSLSASAVLLSFSDGSHWLLCAPVRSVRFLLIGTR